MPAGATSLAFCDRPVFGCHSTDIAPKAATICQDSQPNGLPFERIARRFGKRNSTEEFSEIQLRSSCHGRVRGGREWLRGSHSERV